MPINPQNALPIADLLAADASISLPGALTLRIPDGPRGWYKHGYRLEHDGTHDWRAFYGVQMQVRSETDDALTLEITLSSAHPETVTATVTLVGVGWHTITLPWSAFRFEQARTAFLKFGKAIGIAARAGRGILAIRHVRVIRAEVLALDCAIRGRAAEPNEQVTYTVQIANGAEQAQAVELFIERYGWEAMIATVEPARIVLAPGTSATATVYVTVPERVPPGGHEVQTLRAIPNGDGARAAVMAFTTSANLSHPYILHTLERWGDVRAKVVAYPWAARAQADYLNRAEAWSVPDNARPPDNDPDDTYGPFLFATHHENALMDCGIAYQLTGDQHFADKVALFLRRLSDPETGYPVTLRASNQSLVQEGHFFQHVAMAYDMVLPSGVFSPADMGQIEQTLRTYCATILLETEKGAINNWNIAEIVGALYCALALQDLTLAEMFFSGPSGIKEQLAKGTMDDGWWYECSIAYNAWCASEFSQVALAYAPFGVNFADMRLPASYSSHVALSAPGGRHELAGGKVDALDLNAQQQPFGMVKDLWGPTRRPYREIRDLWNSLIPFIDERGVIFGVNDSTEYLAGRYRFEAHVYPFELAYYLYRDPSYAALIDPNGARDLLYGVPELPEVLPENFRQSAYADNVGVVLLRSQTPNRPIREQIQAALHYGTHGWAHGHFDRTNLLALMRYGRSFYNPEAVWYSYEPFMYKFYVQTSVSKNMVVVDQKMQAATPGERLLFHTGQLMQVTAVQTTARWSNPPYGGMIYDYVPVHSFAEKTWREGRFVPIPAQPPAYGTLTDFTEPIWQRRLLIVADDYIVLVDDIRGTETHTFEQLFQMKGFEGLTAADLIYLRHSAQWNDDPVGSAQFVTDCDWYRVSAPARARFTMRWGEGADNAGTFAPYSADGALTLDVHALYPPQQEIMVGTAPEYFDVQKRLFYIVRSLDTVLAEGRFGAWILGQADIDVDVTGLSEIELETRIELTKSEFARPGEQAFATLPTIFWANGRIVTQDGRVILLADLPVTYTNVRPAPLPNRDYFGGEIKIVGTRYDQALPGEPDDPDQVATVRVDLRGLASARFQVVLGGDFPPGDETQRRKTYASRVDGTQARFITLIEPHEGAPQLSRATALDDCHLRVELHDGRVQEITISSAATESVQVNLRESRDNVVLRTETTGS